MTSILYFAGGGLCWCFQVFREKEAIPTRHFYVDNLPTRHTGSENAATGEREANTQDLFVAEIERKPDDSKSEYPPLNRTENQL